MANADNSKKSNSAKIIELLADSDDSDGAVWEIAQQALAFRWNAHATFEGGKIRFALHPEIYDAQGAFGEKDEHWIVRSFPIDDIIETHFAPDGLEQIENLRAELDRIEVNLRKKVA